MTKKKQSSALAHVQHVWDNARTKSWRQFNDALAAALRNAISSGMTFELGDFAYMAKELRLYRWCGQNLEQYYTAACDNPNPSAVAALEKFLGREPFLWAEKTMTPTRLHIGERFTWKGEFVTVTSFNDKAKKLTAVTYKRPKVFLMSKPVDHEAKKIARRFKIAASDLNSLRLKYDARRRAHEKAFKAATTLIELETAKNAANATRDYRHFDLDILREVAKECEEDIRDGLNVPQQETKLKTDRATSAKERLTKWRAGEDITDFFGLPIAVRVMGNYIEVTNGNKVSIGDARTTLKFVAEHRKNGWESNGTHHYVDVFKLDRVSADGVQIGCTLIPWAEVDRCAELLTNR